jgi:uncharacterized membrane protein YfcA
MADNVAVELIKRNVHDGQSGARWAILPHPVVCRTAILSWQKGVISVLTLVLALICGVVGAVVGVTLLHSTGWAIFLGIICFLVPAILSNLWLKKRLEAVFMHVQEMIAKDQDALRRKINQMQNRMAGGGQGFQRQR